MKIVYIGNKLAAFGSTPTSIDTLGPLLEKEGYELVYGGAKRGQLARLVEMLLTIIRNRKSAAVVLIDAYSTAAFYYALLCGWLCRRFDIPYVPILHGGNFPERLKRSEFMCRSFLGNSYTNVVVSGYLKEHLEQAGYKTVLIENNIELKEYPFKKRENLKPVLLWVRSFDDIYNPQMAIEVLDILTVEYNDVRLIMVGPDRDGSMISCIAMAQKKNLNVEFTDKLSKHEWIKLSEEADVFLNTTNFDNLPVSVLEAMALGLPVVSTNVGGVPYLIEDDRNGLLTNQDDVQGMADAVISLLEDSHKAVSISEYAREYVEQYDWRIVKEKWNKLFEELNV